MCTEISSDTQGLQGSFKGSLKGFLKGSFKGSLKGFLKGSFKGALKGARKFPPIIGNVGFL